MLRTFSSPQEAEGQIKGNCSPASTHPRRVLVSSPERDLAASLRPPARPPPLRRRQALDQLLLKSVEREASRLPRSGGASLVARTMFGDVLPTPPAFNSRAPLGYAALSRKLTRVLARDGRRRGRPGSGARARGRRAVLAGER
jgi:hypothetical protein